ncbi:hypothetical protein ACFL6U_04830 [Planctomycetota bacterium]
MATLMIGAALLVATVVLAARTSEGSWLIYFNSLAQSSTQSGEIEEPSLRIIPERKVVDIHPEVGGIVAVPGQKRAGAQVLR